MECECNGMECNGMESNGIEWNGMRMEYEYKLRKELKYTLRNYKYIHV